MPQYSPDDAGFIFLHRDVHAEQVNVKLLSVTAFYAGDVPVIDGIDKLRCLGCALPGERSILMFTVLPRYEYASALRSLDVICSPFSCAAICFMNYIMKFIFFYRWLKGDMKMLTLCVPAVIIMPY